MVKGKQKMFHAYLKYFKEQAGIGGWVLFERYPSLANIVKNNIDVAYQDFLSYPEKAGDKVSFHGKRYIETPRILSELHGNEQSKYQAIKEKTLEHYNSKIEALRNSGKTDEANFLAFAIKDVDDRFVYCYDDSVVLGVWGMKLKDSARVDDGVYRCSLPLGKTPSLPPVEPPPPPSPEPPDEPQESPDEPQESLDEPQESPDDPDNPTGSLPPKPSWRKRFWLWFTGRGCLEWLLWALLALLLLLLLLWLLRSCGEERRRPIPTPIEDKPWFDDAPRAGDSGGIYNPGNPYTPAPTQPGYENVLPPTEGVLPPADGNPEIIPGNPSIIGNRLNILMENEDKSIMDFAKDFKAKYPDGKYKVVYYDNVVKRMQIEIPSSEREQMRREIPPAFAPEYELFVFDEALFEGSYTPSDPAFADSEKSWYLNAIRAPQAWDITRGSSKLTVAIVDNGFNLSHPELKSKVVMPYNVWRHSADIVPFEPEHGTHVAGIALAAADNGKGLCGVAPECAFMPIQVADANGLMTTTSVLDGILYALYQGADVINVSLGYQFTGLSEFPENVQTDLIINHFKEEERLWRHIMRIAANFNSTIVVAAGNDNVLAGIGAIQRPELIITVAAVDKSNQNLNKAGFSNYGPYADISAPGVGIYNSIGKNGYAAFDGTSMAAPLVTGAIALMKSLNDSLTTKQIICILQSTGRETQGDIGKLIQIDKALEMVISGAEVDCTPPPSTGDVQILLSWNNYNDLDLICTDPYGESVFFRNRRVSSGGQLQIDMNVEYPDSRKPIENIFWQPGSAPEGTYNVYLFYYRRHETDIDATPYNIKVKHGEKTDDYSGTISKADNIIHICTFTLGNPNSPANSNRRLQLEQERDRLQAELEKVNSELRKIENGR
ncbi:MAG: S8 family serine peptidase [Tannerella sp.]|jgi:subtilisin family serine protease|nr:S8 family serine peptidase [Tannerella sp.]